MSEPTPPAEETQPIPKRKRKIKWQLKMALLQIIERKQYTDRPDYKAIAARTGVSVASCKQLWREWHNGRIDMGAPETAEDKKVDARMQQETTVLLLQRYHALLLKDFEAALILAEDGMSNGKKLAWNTASLPRITGELKRIMDIRGMAEKGYNTILDDLANAKNAPKQVGPATIETKIVSANDEQRAVEALTNGNPTPPVSGQTEASFPGQE